MAKIALNMIVAPRDKEADELNRCLKSVAKGVDGIFITITGKNKKVERMARKWGAKISYFDWIKDFSAARNFALSQVPKEYDWIFWCDADDVVHGAENLHTVAEMAEAGNFSAIFCTYFYEVVLDPTRSCPDCGLHPAIRRVIIQHLRERLVRNDSSHKWIGEVHETMIEQRPTNKTDNNSFSVIHLATSEDRHGAILRNAEILENKLLKEEGKDPRTLFYLAKAYFDLHDDELYYMAYELTKDYLRKSGWSEERCQAWEYIAEIHRVYGEHDKSLKALFAALDEEFKFPNIYAQIAYSYMLLGRWQHALHWVKIAAKIPLPRTSVILNPYDLQIRLLEVLFMASINLNMLEEAWAAAQKMVEFLPDNDWAYKRLTMVEELKRNNMLANSIARLAKYYLEKKDQHRLLAVLDAIPQEVANEPAMVDLRNQVMPPRSWEENEVAIYCGPGFEMWSPLSINRGGLGGSETAVVYLSRELTKLGWKVTVFADPREEEGEYDGVKYLPYYYWNPKDGFNVLIAWRQPGLVDTGVRAKKIFVDMHDVGNPAEFTPERLAKIEKIVVKSEAHYQTIAKVPREQVEISTNGIDLDLINSVQPQNNPHWVFWGSSYDRGLIHLLDIWPNVIKEIPDAQLHIFYGWNLFDSVFGPTGTAPNPERQAWREKMNQKMQQSGIIHHGRVAQKELLEWVGKCGLWGYATHFYEINCITALQCQALGCVPVTINYAALKETVQFGEKIDGDIYDPEIKEKYKERLIWWLKHPEEQEKIREKMMKWAREKYDWASVAKQWDSLFRGGEIEEAKKTILDHDPKLAEYMPI